MQICDEVRKKLESKDMNSRYLETRSEFLSAHRVTVPQIRTKMPFMDNDSSDNYFTERERKRLCSCVLPLGVGLTSWAFF